MGPRNRGQLVVSERAFPVGFNNKTLASTENLRSSEANPRSR